MGSEWDLIVAGAGSAGSALASKAAMTGARVLLLEKAEEPGRGRDWIVDVENSVFEEADVPRPSESSSWKEPERTVMSTSDGRNVIDLRPAPLTPLRYGPYVRQLVDWACASGAQLRTQCAVAGLLSEGGAITGVRAGPDGGEELKADLVADCTGIAGTLRLTAPAGWRVSERVQPLETVLARREVRRIDREAASRAVEEGLLPDRVRVVRTAAHGAYSVEMTYLDIEGGFVDILVGIKPVAGLPTADERFEQMLRDHTFIKERIFGDGGPIPIRRPLDSLTGDGFIVLGDSACQVIPAHGSGTASALIAADLAAKAARQAFDKGVFNRSTLWGYSHEFMSGRGALLAYYDVLRTFTDRLQPADVDALLAKGVLTAEEVYSGLVLEVFKPRGADLAKKVRRGASRLPLLARFAMVGLKARKVLRHFQSYPSEYSQEALDSWVSRIPGYP
jgi:flavin-dependent dehydrogenase